MWRCKDLAILFLLLVVLLMAGCATNPVTGKNELMLVSESTEIKMGRDNYLPARQMEGGDYIADKSVESYVNRVGQKMAAVSDRQLPYEFKVVNSPEINAWMMPGGKMGINRGLLLKMDNEAELAAVIGHEITHAAAKHGAKQMQESILLQGGMLAASVLLNQSVHDDRLKGVGVIGAKAATLLVKSKFSRDDEREADHYGMVYLSRAGYDPQAAVSVQELLLKESKGRKDNLFSRLLADHPPSAERVALNRNFARQLPAGGVLGRDEYRRHLAHLYSTAPAYKLYGQAVKAFKSGEYKKVRALTTKAIVQEPNESLFHIMKGKAMEAENKMRQAAGEYRQASILNPGYYEGYLRLGLLLDSQGKSTQAKAALEHSVHLLKTDAALQKLGRYALNDGNIRQAKGYFREAMASSNPAGVAAYADLLRLELPENASAYVGAGLTMSDAGKLLVVLQNNTPFSIGDAVLNMRMPSGRRQIKLNQVLPGNSRRAFALNLPVTAEQLGGFAVTVQSARLAEK